MATRNGQTPVTPQGGNGDDSVMPHIDFSAIPEMSPVPTGKYNATVVNATPGRSRASNSPKIDIRWKLDDGEFAGRLVFDTISFHPNAQWRAKKTLQAINPDVFDKSFNDAVDVNDLIGMSAVIQVVLDTQPGINDQTGEPYEPRNKVANVLPYGSQVTADTLPI